MAIASAGTTARQIRALRDGDGFGRDNGAMNLRPCMAMASVGRGFSAPNNGRNHFPAAR